MGPAVWEYVTLPHQAEKHKIHDERRGIVEMPRREKPLDRAGFSADVVLLRGMGIFGR
jgi:hypothetical protein